MSYTYKNYNILISYHREKYDSGCESQVLAASSTHALKSCHDLVN